MAKHTTSPTSQKILLRALAGERISRPPIWLMRQAGRYLPEYRNLRDQAGSFLKLCYTPELAAEVTLQPLRRFDLDAAILFADLPLIADGLGQALDYREGEGPVLEPIRQARDLVRLQPEKLHRKLSPVYETARLLSAKLPAEIALIGFAGAPWTLATYMVEGGGSADHAHTKRWALSDAQGFSRLIEILEEAIVEYLIGQIEAGCEAVQLFDSWASALNEVEFSRWCIDPVRRIVARLRRHAPQIPIIAFPRGCGFLYQGYAAATGVDCVSLDFQVPIAMARELQKYSVVQGNLDPQLLVVGGEAMAQETARILEVLGQGPFIFNLGHGIVPQTPPEHVAALTQQVRNWSTARD